MAEDAPASATVHGLWQNASLVLPNHRSRRSGGNSRGGSGPEKVFRVVRGRNETVHHPTPIPPWWVQCNREIDAAAVPVLGGSPASFLLAVVRHAPTCTGSACGSVLGCLLSDTAWWPSKWESFPVVPPRACGVFRRLRVSWTS